MIHPRIQLHIPKGIGEKIADKVTNQMGSWNFIIAQSIFLSFWFFLNTVSWIVHWDSYPFVLCNLFMSAEAAFASPLILMSQNRQAEKDRLRDNLEAEEIQNIYDTHDLLLQINQQQLSLLKQQNEILQLLHLGDTAKNPVIKIKKEGE